MKQYTIDDLAVEKLVRIYSNEKETILDPYAGSGATLKACKLAKRNAIGIEIDDKYK